MGTFKDFQGPAAVLTLVASLSRANWLFFFWRSPKRRMVKACAPTQPGLLLWQLLSGGFWCGNNLRCHRLLHRLQYLGSCGLTIDGTNAPEEVVGKMQAFSEFIQSWDRIRMGDIPAAFLKSSLEVPQR